MFIKKRYMIWFYQDVLVQELNNTKSFEKQLRKGLKLGRKVKVEISIQGDHSIENCEVLAKTIKARTRRGAIKQLKKSGYIKPKYLRIKSVGKIG